MATTLGNGTVTFGDGVTQSTAGVYAFGATTFTSSGTFTVPAGVNRIKITLVGGGGRGANGYNTATYDNCGNISGSYWSTGNPGGAGGRGTKWVTGLTPGTVLTVTVGAASTSTVTSGGASSVSGSGMTTITATGGTGGISSAGTRGTAGTAGTFSGSFAIYDIPSYGTPGLGLESGANNGTAGLVLIEYQ